MLYFDHNATTALRPEAWEALAQAARDGGNAASLHRTGQEARRRFEAAQRSVRWLVGAPDGFDVVVTSGGTEADNLALGSAWRGRGRRVLLSDIEHPAVVAAAARLVARGFAIERLPVGRDGRIDPDVGTEDLALVAVMLANNETGVLQPVAEVASRLAPHGVPLHVDAVQAAGKVAIDMPALGAATLALSAHKLGGPRGVGALVVGDPGACLRRDDSLTARRDDLGEPGGRAPAEPRPSRAALMPLWRGGGQQSGLRPGTVPVALAAAMGAAAEAARSDVARSAAVAARRDQLERLLLERAPGAAVIGAGSPRLPNTTAVRFAGVPAAALVPRLDALGLAVSAGAACHAGEAKPSAVLLAMGLSAEQALEVVRLSIGPATTEAEVETAAGIVTAALQEIR